MTPRDILKIKSKHLKWNIYYSVHNEMTLKINFILKFIIVVVVVVVIVVIIIIIIIIIIITIHPSYATENESHPPEGTAAEA
jgi:hypothetical protein